MSSNVSALDQDQVVDPAHPPGRCVWKPNMGGVQDRIKLDPTILGPIPMIPIPSIVFIPPDLPTINANTPFQDVVKSLADVIATKGVSVGAYCAAGYHKVLNNTDPPTAEELLVRERESKAKLRNLQLYYKHQQGSPNSLALRFMADRAGPSYPYEEHESAGKDRKGNPIIGRKCEGCSYWGTDRTRHTRENHVKDPVIGLCCPYYGCDKIHFGGSSRDSEMKLHREDHEKENNGVKKGRKGIMPLSVSRIAYIQ